MQSAIFKDSEFILALLRFDVCFNYDERTALKLGISYS